MAEEMTGALVFDRRTDRYDIRFDLNSYYRGLHCGECFDVFVRGKSGKPTRIEYGKQLVSCGYQGRGLEQAAVASDRRPIKKHEKEDATNCRTKSKRKRPQRYIRPEADRADAQKAMKAILSKGKSVTDRHQGSGSLKRLMKQNAGISH